MLTKEEKIEIVTNRLKNLQLIVKSFIENEKKSRGKYVLKDELSFCNEKKEALLKILKDLGGVWEA
jgi:hypothetical protein